MTAARKYTETEVAAALKRHWGLAMYRNQPTARGRWNGAWKSGWTVSGQFPGHKQSLRRFTSLAEVVRVMGLEDKIQRKTVAQHAVDVLRETNNPGVCYRDDGLIHLIAARAGIPHEGWRTCRKVMNAIERSNRGELEKRFTLGHRCIMRMYALPKQEVPSG